MACQNLNPSGQMFIMQQCSNLEFLGWNLVVKKNHRLPIFTGKGGYFSLQKPVCMSCWAQILQAKVVHGIHLEAHIPLDDPGNHREKLQPLGIIFKFYSKTLGGVVLVPHLLGNCGSLLSTKPSSFWRGSLVVRAHDTSWYQLSEWSNLTHIFEMGWFNHQLGGNRMMFAFSMLRFFLGAMNDCTIWTRRCHSMKFLTVPECRVCNYRGLY